MESASNQAATSAKRHYAIAFAVSLAMSLFFWLGMGDSHVAGFIFWTCIAALLGSSIGLVADRRVVVTVIATAVIRLLIFLVTSWIL